MYEIKYRGVIVKFPYKPYYVQIEYIKRVIDSLEEKGKHAILESPTGTGKTLCLLCATMGWIEKQKSLQKTEMEHEMEDENENENGIFGEGNGIERSNQSDEIRSIPLVVYASRTHSQIYQAMNELKRSHYGYMRAGVVASRDQLCIRDSLKNESNAVKICICRALIKKPKKETKGNEPSPPSCKFYDKYEATMETDISVPELEHQILDIEDLERIGRAHELCPYFMSKDRTKNAEIVFMPYNYLLDPTVRKYNNIKLSNTIVILDEGHNVEKMCEDSACAEIDSSKIRIACRDIEYIIENYSSFKELHKIILDKDVVRLLKCFEKLEKEILDIKILGIGNSYDGDYIFELLEKANINYDNCEMIRTALQTMSELLVQRSKLNELTQNNCPNATGLRSIMYYLAVVFSISSPQLKDRVKTCYKVYIEREPIKVGKNEVTKPDVNAKKVNFWCFSAAFGMQHLIQKKIRNLILTSGTLAPLKPLITDMEISNPIQLTNPHIIKKFQMFVKVIDKGVDGTTLNSNYENRKNEKYLQSLGNTIIEFSKTVPDGLLVFFPSYPVMNNCIDYWKKKNIWSQINQVKQVFLEPKLKQDFQEAQKNYYATINDQNSNGATFMAVMRGKISEGLDFANMYGRAVIIIGIPYGPCKDPKIQLKKAYLEKNRTTENEMLSGNEWYVLDAMRAVNQAIGRVIRHKDDYGAILLCDSRFGWTNLINNMPAWITAHLQKTNAFDSMIEDLKNFYINAKEKLPEPERGTEMMIEEDATVVDLSVNNGNDSIGCVPNHIQISPKREVVDQTASGSGINITPLKRMKLFDGSTSTPIKIENEMFVLVKEEI